METESSIFLSYSSEDKLLVSKIQEQLNVFFGGGVRIDASTIPGTTDAGNDWLTSITQKLRNAEVAIFVMTPSSIQRPWVWFELGLVWERYKEQQLPIIPLCCCVKLSSLPLPIGTIQAVLLSERTRVEAMLDQLRQQFGLGTATKDRSRALVKACKTYCNYGLQKEIAPVKRSDLITGLQQAAQVNVLNPSVLEILKSNEVLTPDEVLELESFFPRP